MADLLQLGNKVNCSLILGGGVDFSDGTQEGLRGSRHIQFIIYIYLCIWFINVHSIINIQ